MFNITIMTSNDANEINETNESFRAPSTIEIDKKAMKYANHSNQRTVLL